MSRHTDTPWRVGVGPYESGQIYGIDREDGSKQLIAQVFGYSHAERVENMKIIVDGLKVMGYVLDNETQSEYRNDNDMAGSTGTDGTGRKAYEGAV